MIDAESTLEERTARAALKRAELYLAAAGHPRLADMAHEIRKALENDRRSD